MAGMVPVILCGGGGTRLWPRSRRARPKPFLPLVGPDSLFDQALSRCSDAQRFAPPLIVTGASHLEYSRTELAMRLGATTIVEPQSRNTAAAVALAALRLPHDAVMLVCPSDHQIDDLPAFVDLAQQAATLASDGWLVCLGIEPHSPETRFGYIRRGPALGPGAFKVAEFIEKPDLAAAAAHLASGECSWNSGIFAFRAGDYLAELQRYRPAMAAAAKSAVAKGVEDADGRFFPDPAEFAAIEAESLDYAVLENTDRAAVIPASMGWSDLGNWFALHGARTRDQFGNSVRGPVEILDCRNVMVDTDGPRVSLIGLDDVIVVVDGDDIMITSAASAHDVAKFARVRNG